MELVGLTRKSFGPNDDARAIERAARGLVGVSVPTPLYHRGRRLGLFHWDARAQGVVGYRCAINSYNDLIAAVAAGQHFKPWYFKSFSVAQPPNVVYYDYWNMTGDPETGQYTGTAATARQFTDADNGALAHGGNVSPKIKILTSAEAFQDQSNEVFLWIVYDRVLAYEALTPSGALANFTNTLAAQRYISSGQSGLQILATYQSSTLSGAFNVIALSYTDQSGNTGNTLGAALAVSSTFTSPDGDHPAAVCHTLGPFVPLAAGDWGVRSIQSWTTSASRTGSICFALVHPIASVILPLAPNGLDHQYQQFDFVRQIVNCERIYDGACLSAIGFCSSATMTNPYLRLGVTWA